MSSGERSFLDFLEGARLRFLQERVVGLDLYHSGLLGTLAFCLAIASLTVFALALFQIIPKRKHTVGLLIGLGAASLIAGLCATYLNFRALPEAAGRIIRDTAGNAPTPGSGEEAAVVAIPLLLGAVTFGANILGCAYLAIFWTSDRG